MGNREGWVDGWGWGGEFRFCCWIQQKHIHINIYVELFDVYYGATSLFNDRWMDGWKR